MNKGIIQQMQEAAAHEGTSDHGALDDIRNVIFDTSTKPPDPRYLWYGPIGWLRIMGGHLMVTDNPNEDPCVFRELTNQERSIWKDAFRP